MYKSILFVISKNDAVPNSILFLGSRSRITQNRVWKIAYDITTYTIKVL